MERLSIESLIVDENELAEHYKEVGNEYGYKGKSKLVEYLKELKTYKDAEEQGLILRLPVAIGSTVYVIDSIYECKFNYDCKLSFDAYKCEEDIRCEHEYKKYRTRETKFNHMMLDKIGETVFLTKEEAEQALKQMGEGV